jgi:[acyl-carrier-protein] S-malonyltransferase
MLNLIEPQDRKIAFMFPAIGGHRVGMCDFLGEYGIDPLEKVSQNLGIDLRSIGKQGPKEQFDLIHNAKPIIYAHSLAIGNLLKNNGILPDVVVGYSLGEYAALCAAGVFEYGDALKFLYQVLEMNKGLDILGGLYGMALVRGPDKNELEKVCRQIRNPGHGKKGRHLYLSCINAPNSHMVSGEKQAFETLQNMFKRIRILDGSINIPSHSPLVTHMEQICTPYLEDLLITAKKPESRFISSVTGKYTRDKEEIAQNLKCLLTSRLNWIDAVHTMIQSGINTFIEVGHKSGLSNQVQLCAQDSNDLNFFYTDNKKNLDRVLSSL